MEFLEYLKTITKQNDNGCLEQILPLNFEDIKLSRGVSRRFVYEKIKDVYTSHRSDAIHLKCGNRFCLNIEHMELMSKNCNHALLEKQREERIKLRQEKLEEDEKNGKFFCPMCHCPYEWIRTTESSNKSEVCSIGCLLRIGRTSHGYGTCNYNSQFREESIFYKGESYSRREAAISIKEKLDLTKDIEKIKDFSPNYICMINFDCSCFNLDHLLRIDNEDLLYLIRNQPKERVYKIVESLMNKYELILINEFTSLNKEQTKDIEKIKKDYEILKLLNRVR